MNPFAVTLIHITGGWINKNNKLFYARIKLIFTKIRIVEKFEINGALDIVQLNIIKLDFCLDS